MYLIKLQTISFCSPDEKWLATVQLLPDGCTGIDGSTLHVVTAWKGITGSSGVWLDTKIQKERPIETEDAFQCLIHHIGAGKVQEHESACTLADAPVY